MPEITTNILITLGSSLLSGVSIGGIIVLYFRKRIDVYFSERNNRIQTEREAMLKFLEIWYYRRSNYTKDGITEFTKSLREVMLWCPNNVLYHLGMYLSLYGKPEAEKHFGKAVICYRRTLGYKNRWWKKVTPDHIFSIWLAIRGSWIKNISIAKLPNQRLNPTAILVRVSCGS